MAMFIRWRAGAVLLAVGCFVVGCNETNSPVAQRDVRQAPPVANASETVKVDETPATTETPVAMVAPKVPSVPGLPNCAAGCESGCMPGDTSAVVAKGSHKQVGVLKPTHEGLPIELNTFCVTSQGDILACVGGDGGNRAVPDPENPGQYKVVTTATKRLIQVYDADHKLKNEVALSFKPTAINTTPDGQSFYVAGEGRIAHVRLNGEIVREAATPNIGDPERFKEKALAAQKRDMEQYTQQFTEMAAQQQTQIDEIEAIAEDERTEQQKAQLKAARTQKEGFEQSIKAYEQMMGSDNLDQVVKQRMVVTAVAATDKDVFVCCRALKGHGYEIWRTTLDLDETEAELIVDGVSGCCGQLDIQAEGDNLYVAENGRFQVGIYDREGERLNGFGKRDRKVVEGFGSCCNPMNIRVFPDGSVLTAESSIGNLKRFDKDGKFVAYIGKAKVSGGCKHVACGFDAERNRYYFMNVDQQHICVLAPATESGEETEDERMVREAKEGLAKKLEGSKWKVAGAKEEEEKTPDVPQGFAIMQGAGSAYEFGSSGEFKAVGGMLGQYSGMGMSLEWAPVKQDGKTLHCDILMDGVANYNFTVEFESDDVATLQTNFGVSAKIYRDGTPEPPAAQGAAAATDPISTLLRVLTTPAAKAETSPTDETDGDEEGEETQTPAETPVDEEAPFGE